MSRALFSVLPRSAALARLIQKLNHIGIGAHNISTLRFESESTPGQVLNGPAVARQIHATGQLKWAVQGASSTGATRRVARALAGMGMPEAAARHYQECVRTGSTLLCVFCETVSQAKDAVSVLKSSGVRELASTGTPEMVEHSPDEPNARSH